MPRSGSANSTRLARLVAGVTVALCSAMAFVGCSAQDARALASQACRHVEQGLSEEQQAGRAGAARGAELRTLALDQIRDAVPYAAEAAGDDTSWQALEATLGESSRVPVRYLLPALSAQCAGV